MIGRRRILELAIVVLALGTLGTLTSAAHATEWRTGATSCASSQHVVIVSYAAGKLTHSFAIGPEHLGYPIYRQTFGLPVWYEYRQTPTFKSYVRWQVTAADYGGWRGDINDAYGACIRR